MATKAVKPETVKPEAATFSAEKAIPYIIYADDEQKKTRIYSIPLTALKSYEFNPLNRIKQVSPLQKSMTSLGQLVPMLVVQNEDGTYTVVDGNRRLNALRKMKKDDARCIIIGGDTADLFFACNEATKSLPKKAITETRRLSGMAGTGSIILQKEVTWLKKEHKGITGDEKTTFSNLAIEAGVDPVSRFNEVYSFFSRYLKACEKLKINAKSLQEFLEWTLSTRTVDEKQVGVLKAGGEVFRLAKKARISYRITKGENTREMSVGEKDLEKGYRKKMFEFISQVHPDQKINEARRADFFAAK